VTRKRRELDAIIGKGRALLHVLDQVETVARMPSPVLILGETGTGKELIARAIHKLSARHDGPLYPPTALPFLPDFSKANSSATRKAHLQAQSRVPSVVLNWPTKEPFSLMKW